MISVPWIWEFAGGVNWQDLFDLPCLVEETTFSASSVSSWTQAASCRRLKRDETQRGRRDPLPRSSSSESTSSSSTAIQGLGATCRRCNCPQYASYLQCGWSGWLSLQAGHWHVSRRYVPSARLRADTKMLAAPPLRCTHLQATAPASQQPWGKSRPAPTAIILPSSIIYLHAAERFPSSVFRVSDRPIFGAGPWTLLAAAFPWSTQSRGPPPPPKLPSTQNLESRSSMSG